MLQELSDQVVDYLVLAAAAERRAAEASNEALRVDNERMAERWRSLASHHQFMEKLERFLLDAEQAKRLRTAKSPAGTEDKRSRRSGAKFDPETISLLTSAYAKAMGDEPAVREVITRHIIDLVCEGERDPDLLYEGAVARSKPPVAWEGSLGGRCGQASRPRQEGSSIAGGHSS